ncbi:UNVERIFIED_CONTAM: hypothetical protein FKN15_042874 [Acipenser sinensis]
MCQSWIGGYMIALATEVGITEGISGDVAKQSGYGKTYKDELCYKEPILAALKLLSLFGCTYICEQVFSLMKLNKSHLRTRLTDDDLHAVLRVATTSLEPNIPQLVTEKNCSH